MTASEAANLDTSGLIKALEASADSIDVAVAYIQAVRGAVHFREAVELLLVGTPYEKPVGEDLEGLYGRVPAALLSVRRT